MGTFTGEDGTVVEFTGDESVDFELVDGLPELTIEPSDGGPEINVNVDDDGSTTIDVDDGATITPPDETDITIDPDGATVDTSGGPGPGPGGPGPGPGGPGPGPGGPGPGPGPGSPFSPNHPNPLPKRDPLVLDLNGSGIDLTEVHASNAHFDYGGTGFSVRTGWVAPTEGILIRDIDQNSAVTADELFGATSGNGFADLADLDTNQDGKIDSTDSVFADLKVWQDADTDGVGDAGELISLADAGISAINLNAQLSGQTNNGNLIIETSTFTRTDGTTGTIAEVNFATDTLDSQYTPPEGFEFSPTAFLLPNLIGYGLVPNLIYAMSLDSDLKDAVREFVLGARTMSGQDFDAGFETLIQKWTGSDGIDPSSRGPLINARHMAVVEAFYGATFEEMNGPGVTLNVPTATLIESAYQAIVDELKIRFAAQVTVSELLNGTDWQDIVASPLLPYAAIDFDPETDTIGVDFDTLVQRIAQKAPADEAEQFGYYDLMARIVKATRVDLFNENTSALVSAFATAATAAGISSAMQVMIVAEIQAGSIVDTTGATGSVNGTNLSEAFLISEGGHTVGGGHGSDTYLYTATAGGSTTISDSTFSSGDKVFLVDVDPADVVLSRSGDSQNLTLSIVGGGSVTLAGQFSGYTGVGIETVQFADGTTWTAAQIKQMVLDQYSAASSGSVYGYEESDDTLVAGLGGKFLSGLSGNDTYVYAQGDGNVTVYDASYSSGDELLLSDVASGDVQLSRPNGGDDLVLTIAGTGETITIQDQFLMPAVGAPYAEIEEIHFADDIVWTADDVRTQLLAEAKTTGDDTIVGFHTADRLDGGAGDDRLEGQGGGDTYVFGRGYGHDVVDAYIVYVTRNQPDTIEFTADVAPEDVQIARSGDDLVLTISGTDDRLTIEDHFSSLGYTRVENFSFANGTTWTWEDVQLRLLVGTSGDDELVGSVGNDYLDGGAGNDLLKGGKGDDTYVFGIGYGRDVINDDNLSVIGNAPDRLVFNAGVAVSDLEFVRVGPDDLVIRINGTDDEVTIKHQFDSYYEISNFEFADGTVLSTADVQDIIDNGGTGHVTHRGTAAAEVIVGTGIADIFDGRGGADTLQGEWGSDTYLYGAGSGNDTIEENGLGSDVDKVVLIGLNSADVTLGRTGNDLVVTIIATGEALEVAGHFTSNGYGIEQLVFADGTTWDRTTIQAQAWLLGTSGADTIAGTSANETIDGLGGADTLDGSWGSDTYMYGVGSGNDTIQESGLGGDIDKIKLAGLLPADVSLARIGNDLFVTINSSGEKLKVQNHFVGAGYAIEQLVFADATTWDSTKIQSEAVITGTSGAETLAGSSASETLDGLGGADSLNGGAGSDTYLYRVGSGNDTITENSDGNAIDKVKLVGLDPSDVTLRRSGDHLYIKVNASGEELKVQNHFYSTTLGIEQLIFADATTWDRTQILGAAWIVGTSSGETINGTSDPDTIDGLGGNDTLKGAANGDTYIYASGSGNDTIIENSDGAAIDKVKLVGLNPSDVTFSRTGDHLTITITATGEQLKIQDHFYSTTWGVEQLIFGDNTTWDRATIVAQVPTTGTSGNDTINGTSSDNALRGGLGNDTLLGGAGHDVYLYASGDGNDTIDDESGSTSEVDTLWFSNINAGDITLTRSGYDVKINVTATGEQISVLWPYWNASQNWGIDQVRFADGTTWNRDTIMQKVWWNGTTGNDTMSGWGSYDQIDGGSGNDTISGNAGIDIIVGGAGDDTLSGGSGNDTYVFNAGFGQDTIADFATGSGSDDAIDIDDNIFADYSAVIAAAATSGSDTIITVDASNKITLTGVALASLHQDDFRFH